MHLTHFAPKAVLSGELRSQGAADICVEIVFTNAFADTPPLTAFRIAEIRPSDFIRAIRIA